MKIINRIKNNKGVTLTDIIIALVILIISTGVLTNSFYQIYKHNVSIRMDADALNYTIKILEGIDKMKYEDITEELDLNTTFEIPEDYVLTLKVEKYNQDDDNMQDLIKIINLKIEYESINETKTYSVKKLKIKEI